MTVDEADALIGSTGDVVHPSKGVQGPPGGWKVVGYAPSEEDPLTVLSLKLESVRWTDPTPIHGTVKNPDGGTALGVLETIAPHPVEIRPRCNPRHFKPHSQAPAARVAVAK